MSEPKFIHLNIHSDYSIQDSLCKIDNIVKKSLDCNMPCVALTDFFSLSAIIKFIKLSYNYGIKPIVGSDICVLYKNYTYNITLLIMNEIGYINLIKLISLSYKNKFKNKGKLIIDNNLLLKFNDGLIFLYYINYGYINYRNFINYDFSILEEYLCLLKKYIYDRLYIQIFRINALNENKYLNIIINIANSNNLPLVATNKVLFFCKEDFYIHKIRSAIYHNCSLNKVKLFINYTDQQYFKNEYEMYNLFSDIPEALYNSVQIAKKCNFIFKKKKIILPKYPFSKEKSHVLLKKLVYKGLYKRINFSDDNNLKKKYLFRIKKELNIINILNISDYFLIVMEFVKWSKLNDIWVGPGRGSGAGSLVAYLLFITEIDPLKFGLIFERFLNLERISMPDFDIDFCMNKRDKVISHIENIYGYNCVAQIVTFNTLTAKSVLRDVGRVLGYSYNFIDYLAKLIPYDINITLNKALLQESKLLDIYNSDIEVKKLIDISICLEGIIKGIGKHAGGIVISSSNVYNYCSLYYDEESKRLVTQLDKNDIEYVGLIKFDLLGLRTLTVINNSIKMIRNKLNSNFNINNISLDDKLSFKLLKQAKTVAVFQLESMGMRDLIKRLEPDNFNEIIALLALFRPGPLQSGMVENFINRKKGREKIYYPDVKWQHKLLIPILKCTYGIILYQEQVMQIAQVLANYNLALADSLRMSMSKKDYHKMKLHRKIFKKGSISLGIDSKLSMKIFSLMENFSSYGFNKSHSVAYSFLAYQTLWLKTHFTSEYMASYMNADIDNINKITLIINESRKMGIKIIPPNINISKYYFSINNQNELLYGLGAIKGIGKSSVDLIIKLRNKYGDFKDFISFCILTFSNKISKLVLEKLIYAGAFDLFNINRSILIKNIKKIMLLSKYKHNELFCKQLSLFGNKSINELLLYKKITNMLPLKNKEFLLHKEKEVLGLYITDHPIHKYILDILKKYKNIYRIRNLYFLKVRKNIYIFGLIVNIKFLFTKNRNRICILSIDDSSGSLEVILLKDIYNQYSSLIEINNIIIILGLLKFEFNKYNISFLANKIILYNKE